MRKRKALGSSWQNKLWGEAFPTSFISPPSLFPLSFATDSRSNPCLSAEKEASLERRPFLVQVLSHTRCVWRSNRSHCTIRSITARSPRITPSSSGHCPFRITAPFVLRNQHGLIPSTLIRKTICQFNHDRSGFHSVIIEQPLVVRQSS